jgi:hypothetical protein
LFTQRILRADRFGVLSTFATSAASTLNPNWLSMLSITSTGYSSCSPLRVSWLG